MIEYRPLPTDDAARAAGCYFDLASADRVRAFCRRFLRHSKGGWASKPFELLDWQWRDFIAPVFGWKRADGRRRFNRVYVEIPKKNGKSTLCAALALYLLIADREQGAEVYSAAADRDQAGIVFNESLNMVQASAGLSDVIVPVKSKKLLEFPHTKSIYKALSADVPTKEGLNIHGLIFDELHAQKTRKLWDTLKYGGRARSQPIFIAITTAGYDRESICYEQHTYARSIERGENTEDIHYYPYIRSADIEDDWTDPAVWRKANPSLGITIPEDTFAQECREARMSPTAENTFRRYSLNQWTQQDVRWLNMFDWDKCAGSPDEAEMLATECYGGLDLATTDDMNAFVLFWPKFCACKCWFWVPEDCVRNRAVRARHRYDDYISRGLVRTTEGNTADHSVIKDDILDIRSRYKKIRLVGVDRWNSSQIVRELTAAGVKLEGFAQGFASMNGPAKDLEVYVRTHKLQHGGNPVLRWHAGNAAVEIDSAANIKPSKKASGEKVDGIVALVMAIGLATKSIRRKSVYNEKGIEGL